MVSNVYTAVVGNNNYYITANHSIILSNNSILIPDGTTTSTEIRLETSCSLPYVTAQTTTTAYSTIGSGYYRIEASNIVVSSFDQPVYTPKINRTEVKRTEYKARSVIKRGIRLFENLFGIGQINLFLHGEGISVEGRRFNYLLSRQRYVSLLNKTKNVDGRAAPYKIQVLSKQNLVLFSGCTYFKNTPIVDQLIALILHIKDNEEHVLLNMNLFGFTEHFKADKGTKRYLSNLKGIQY